MHFNTMDPQDDKEREGYLYAVLNLPKEATHAEINDRHRSLSLVFHPDKQTDEQLKAAATKEFLEIQKAYQVLSDPFLRQVYDTLGNEGLKVKWPPHLRLRTPDEIQEALAQTAVTIERRKLRQSISPRGRFTWSVDASRLFGSDDATTSDVLSRVKDGINSIQTVARSLGYSTEKKLNDKTSLILEGRSHMQGAGGSVRFLGAVRHQFSPRLNASSTIHFIRPYLTQVDVNYDDGNNIVDVNSTLSPFFLFKHIPTTTASYSRRLFRDAPERGKIALRLAGQPSISFFYVSPATLTLEDEDSPPQMGGPPTTSGFKYVAYDRNFGVVFETIVPKLVAEASIHLIELSTRLKCTLEYGFTGALAVLGVYWNNETTEASTSLVLSAAALVLEFHFSHLGNQLDLPIVLSTEFSPRLALGAIVVPSTVIALSYHFIIMPRRRARRIAHLRAARRAFEEDTDARRERAAVESLLKEAVKKQIRIETDREGLIIQEATYGAVGSDEENLLLDVTVPIQALVRNSQLHIPGGESKSVLQGFSDPAPFASKVLRIRYLFRGRVHYAEIPDYLPIVLPLAEHQINASRSQWNRWRRTD